MISDLTGLAFSGNSQQILRLLVLMNALLHHGGSLQEIPQHRLVLFVKNIVNWFEQDLLESVYTTAEVATTLTAVLPLISDVYGSHWSSILEFIIQVCSDQFQKKALDQRIPATHATLKLLSVFRRSQDANDDARDAWNDLRPEINHCLISLLKLIPRKLSI